MLYISKGPQEPPLLREFRETTPHASYAGLSGNQREEIREYLLKEQGSLCAYCMRRIDVESSTIEHYLAQEHPDTPDGKDLDYRNMLGVCQGKGGISNS